MDAFPLFIFAFLAIIAIAWVALSRWMDKRLIKALSDMIQSLHDALAAKQLLADAYKARAEAGDRLICQRGEIIDEQKRTISLLNQIMDERAKTLALLGHPVR